MEYKQFCLDDSGNYNNEDYPNVDTSIKEKFFNYDGSILAYCYKDINNDGISELFIDYLIPDGIMDSIIYYVENGQVRKATKDLLIEWNAIRDDYLTKGIVWDAEWNEIDKVVTSIEDEDIVTRDGISVSVTVSDLVGNWSVDNEYTMNHSSESLKSMYGSSYNYFVPHMTFGEDGAFEFYIGVEGGVGTYTIQDGKVIISYEDSNGGGNITDELIAETDGVLRLMDEIDSDNRPYAATYWIKD